MTLKGEMEHPLIYWFAKSSGTDIGLFQPDMSAKDSL